MVSLGHKSDICTMNCLARSLATMAALALAAPSSAEVTTMTPAQSAGYAPLSVSAEAAAQELMRSGRFEEALSVLAPLLQGDTALADTLFLYGLAALGASQKPGISEEKRDAFLDLAIDIFSTMLETRPELDRVRLELARALFLKGEDSLSKKHFERVLAGGPPPPVVRNINRFLTQIQARKRWNVYAGLTLAPDSNVSRVSNNRTIWIDTGFGNLPFTYDKAPKSGVGISAWVGGEYRYPLSDRSLLRVGADVHRREYRGSEFDQMTLSSHIGPRWLIGDDAETSVLAVMRRNWQAGDAHHLDAGLRIEGSRRLDQRTTASLEAAWFKRRHDDTVDLDGPVMEISLGWSRRLTSTLLADLRAGWSKERPERKNQRNEGRWVQAGITAALPGGFTAGGSAALRWRDYEGNWFPFTEGGRARKDLTRVFRLSVQRRSLVLWGFSPRFSLVREKRTSNAQLHSYGRTFGEIDFVRQF